MPPRLSFLRLRLVFPAVLFVVVLAGCAVSMHSASAQTVDPRIGESGGVNDPSIQSDYRKGNCCHPYYYDETTGEEYLGSYNPETNRMECTWNVGTYETDPKLQIAACRNLEFQGTEGQSYNYENWYLCNAQCEDQARMVYCDPYAAVSSGVSEGHDAYSCVEKADLDGDLNDPLYRSKVTGYPTLEGENGCLTHCLPPVDLTTSIGCSCNRETQQNRCTIYVEPNPSDPALTDVNVKTLMVKLLWSAGQDIPTGSLTGEDGSTSQIYGYVENEMAYVTDDPNLYEEPVAYEGRFLDVDGTFTELEFVPENGFPLIIPPGHWFRADLLVEASDNPAANRVEGTVSVFVNGEIPDPNSSNNKAGADISSLKDCRAFDLNAECEYSTDLEDPNPTYLYHTYTLDLGDYESQNPSVDFALDSCLVGQEDSIRIPDVCELIVDQNGYPIIHCEDPMAAGLKNISFKILAQSNDFEDPDVDDRACRVGEEITVTATIMVDGQLEPDVLTVAEPKIVCGLCDICGSALDDQGQPWESLCYQAPFSDHCRWDVTKAGVGRCVADDNKCDVYIGCCRHYEEDVGVEEGHYYLYAGRVDTGFTTEQFITEYDDTTFEDVQECYNDGVRRDANPEDYAESDTDITFYQKDRTDFHDIFKDGVNKYDYWRQACEEQTLTLTPETTGGKSSAGTVSAKRPYYCSDKFDQQEFAQMSFWIDEGLDSYTDCEIYGNQNIREGTVYFETAYRPTDVATEVVTFSAANGIEPELDPEEEGYKLSCPAVCFESKKIVTCCMASSCTVGVLDEDCIGGMGLLVGDAAMATCETRRGEGRCGPFPPEGAPGG